MNKKRKDLSSKIILMMEQVVSGEIEYEELVSFISNIKEEDLGDDKDEN